MSNCWAWWSARTLFSSTHHKITDDALDLVNDSYADINRFGSDISNWTSGTTDDVRAHDGDALANGGPIHKWWGLAQEAYASRNLNSEDWSAYYYISLMMHLIEDQAVPAHAYDIPHGSQGYPMDNLEELVYTNYNPAIAGSVAANSPLSNYAGLKNFTIGTATADDYWRQYWGFMNYGGPDGTDVFPTFWISTGEPERNLIGLLLGNAAGYTSGALVSVSESLPPLITHTDILAPNYCVDIPAISDHSKAQIIINVADNRSRYITIFPTVDDAPIISGNGIPYEMAVGSDFPWEGEVVIDWDGRLSSGQLVDDGQHSIGVRIRDEDGHYSETYELSIVMDTSAPGISFSGAVDGGSYESPIVLEWSVTDNLDSNPIQSSIHASGTTFFESNEVVVSAEDCAGNENTQSLRFTIANSTSSFCESECASRGACSWHGGVNCVAGPDIDGSVICNDGWRDSSVQYLCH